ncbi:hypothetical protein J2S47_003684 [Streptomyces griseoviridis]|uniref:Uncharacterized protein n=1 Tax=Streptomyces griseoviridis TaxID=45398 RepID=A0ABT9LKC2_STRGD|nr:hypothetical protein [Streptomyces griseoviridis]
MNRPFGSTAEIPASVGGTLDTAFLAELAD